MSSNDPAARFVLAAPGDERVGKVLGTVPDGYDWPIGRLGTGDDDAVVVVAIADRRPVGLAALRAAGDTTFEVRRLGVWALSEDQRRRVALDLLATVAKQAAERGGKRVALVVLNEWGQALVEKSMADRLTALPLHPRHPGGEPLPEPQVVVTLASADEQAEIQPPRGFDWPIGTGARSGEDTAVAVARRGGRIIGLAALRHVGDEFHVRRLGIWEDVPMPIGLGLDLLDALAGVARPLGARELVLTPRTPWGRELINQAHFSSPMPVRTAAPRSRWRRGS